MDPKLRKLPKTKLFCLLLEQLHFGLFWWVFCLLTSSDLEGSPLVILTDERGGFSLQKTQICPQKSLASRLFSHPKTRAACPGARVGGCYPRHSCENGECLFQTNHQAVPGAWGWEVGSKKNRRTLQGIHSPLWLTKCCEIQGRKDAGGSEWYF